MLQGGPPGADGGEAGMEGWVHEWGGAATKQGVRDGGEAFREGEVDQRRAANENGCPDGGGAVRKGEVDSQGQPRNDF